MTLLALRNKKCCFLPPSSPSVVVARVDSDGRPVAAEGLLQLLGGDVLVPQQGVGVGARGLNLRQPRNKITTKYKIQK